MQVVIGLIETLVSHNLGAINSYSVESIVRDVWDSKRHGEQVLITDIFRLDFHGTGRDWWRWDI